jgi:hypothetical protein
LQASAEQVNLHRAIGFAMEPSPKPAQRDGLGRFCFWLHVFVLLFIVAGWLLPLRGALIAYVMFLPAVMLHWKLNQDACVLNNIESWLRHGRWRAPEKNAEEGAWLRTLIASLTGVTLTRRAMDVVIYSAMTLFWALGLVHFLHFQGA